MRFAEVDIQDAYDWLTENLQVEFKGSVSDAQAQSYYLAMIPEHLQESYGVNTTVRLANFLYEILGWKRVDTTVPSTLISGKLYVVTGQDLFYPRGTVFSACQCERGIAWVDGWGVPSYRIPLEYLLHKDTQSQYSALGNSELAQLCATHEHIKSAQEYTKKDSEADLQRLLDIFEQQGIEDREQLADVLGRRYSVLPRYIRELFSTDNIGIVRAVLYDIDRNSPELADDDKLCTGTIFVANEESEKFKFNKAMYAFVKSSDEIWLSHFRLSPSLYDDYTINKCLLSPLYLEVVPTLPELLNYDVSTSIFEAPLHTAQPFTLSSFDCHQRITVRELETLISSHRIYKLDKRATKQLLVEASKIRT